MKRKSVPLTVGSYCLVGAGLFVLTMLSACSSGENHTDKQAAMARMTYSPEKCEQVGAVYYTCSGDHSLPDADAGMIDSGKSNDTRLIRTGCPDGFHYEEGNGCQKD
jgi:hypothetical protein